MSLRDKLRETFKSAVVLVLTITLVITTMPPAAMAQQGGVITNGSQTQPTYIAPTSEAAAGVPGTWFTTPPFNFGVSPSFLFEPESPYASLKEVPTWNEVEQVLDNPYRFAVDPNTPGNFDGYPSYRTTITRRPNLTAGSSLLSPGPALPQFLIHPLNYNPGTGEEMRILNPGFPGGPFALPFQLVNCAIAPLTPGCQGSTDPNKWAWTYHTVNISPGSPRVQETAVDYDGPIGRDPYGCVVNLELIPPEGTQLCGFDPGEPRYAGFGLFNGSGYSTPAVRFLPSAPAPSPATPITTQRLYDPAGRGTINPRSPNGFGGLRKPSLRTSDAGGNSAAPNYLVNTKLTPTSPDSTMPSTENDYYRPSGGTLAGSAGAGIPLGRNAAIALGKSLFWDMQIGSDGVQSCGTCHFTGAGTDTRTRNQINPNHFGVNGFSAQIDLHGSNTANQDLAIADFPFHKLANPDIAGDPACSSPIIANVSSVTPALDHPVSGNFTVCDAGNILHDIDDVSSSMGVIYGTFLDIQTPGAGAFSPPTNGVAALKPDLRGHTTDPISEFQGFRRVEPRNTPTMQAAGFNFDNFWDGRARHDFNGGSVFGAADPQAHVWINNGGSLTSTRQLIKFTSIASLATGPALSEFEMSFQGRNWSKHGKRLLQAGITPLANQLVDPTDSVLGPYSNQPGNPSARCSTATALASRAVGKPGLCVTYPDLVRASYFPALWSNTAQHLNGCYTDGDLLHAANQCSAVGVNVAIPVLNGSGSVVNSSADPFDNYVLSLDTTGPSDPANTNQFSQMEANFSMFWGLSVQAWVNLLVPDDTPFDRFLTANPDAFMSLGDTSEALLVDDLVNCTSATQRNCFRESGAFKRDANVVALHDCTAPGGVGCVSTPAPGTRNPTDPDPLLGADIFFASNLSLKNPNFRSGRCGACHNMPTLTDHTVPFTHKAQLPDFASEFSPAAPGVELLTEPLGRLRMISGFLLESEISETGQDAVERRFINQSLAPNPGNGYAYPDGVFNPGTGPDGFTGAGQAFIDNGVYNLGVRPIANDIGRGGTDAFGWPLSLASLLMKNLGGPAYEPNVPPNSITGDPGRGSGPMQTFDSSLGPEGGLFEESGHDQQLNPGGTDEAANPQLPDYLAPFAPGIVVGDSQPELDEPDAGINTLTDVALAEGFIDVIGPVSPSATKNEALNMGDTQLMGTWPVVNRVIRDGAFKAPQLRNVELSGPYFHNGGMLTLRQVVDFYARGGDFPITNAQHRDFLLTNLNIEAQSNLSEEEKVALVDFLLQLTDERVAHDQAPFDHPEVIVPVDGTAPDNDNGRAALLAKTAPNTCGAGGADNGACYRDVPAVGTNGFVAREPAFLNLTNQRLSRGAVVPGTGDALATHDSQYSE